MNKSSISSHKKMSNLPNWLWPNSNSLPPLYKKIWEVVQEDKCRPDGIHGEVLVDTNKIFPLLLTSQLPTEVLGFIWSLANQKYAGQLTEQELYIVLSLVSLAQSSCSFDSLEVLQFIHTPPIPNLNLSFMNMINNEAKSQELSTELNLATISKKHENMLQPTNKLDDLSPNANRGFNNYNNNLKIKEVKFSSDQLFSQDLNDTSVYRQNLHIQPDIKHQSSCVTDSAEEFSDFQSAPVTNSGILNVWDSKQGSAIGSRLANHNLGVKKLNDKAKKNIPSKSNNSIQNTVTSNLLFTNKDIHPDEQSTDHFFKCSLKNQTKTVILKDTAIRNREPTAVTQYNTINFSEKAEKKISDVNSSLMKCTNFPKVEGLQVNHSKKSEEAEPQQDLMSLQPSEDKYSALRALVDGPMIMSDPIPNEDATVSPVDDFGDFVSAEQLNSEQTTEISSATNSLDQTSHLESISLNITSTHSISSPQLIDKISDVFGTLSCHQPVEKQLDKNLDNALNSGKYIRKEKNLIENNVEQCKITSTNTPTRSESAQSLDFKPTSRQEKERLENSIQTIYWKWKQYMESCIILLKMAANIFTNITSETVLREVLSSAQGYDFLCDLAEIAAVCRRVNFSHKEMDVNIIGFDDLMVDIDKIWSEMEPFYTNIPIVTELPAWPFHQDDVSCALCLTSITNGRVMYNKYNYHVTCANLWLHTVNSHLPILQYPTSFQEGTFIDSTNSI